MSRKPVRRARPDSVDAAVVHERDGGGDLVATAWVELLMPPEWYRVVEKDGQNVIEFHALFLAALISQGETRDNLHRALNLCRCVYPVIRSEDL